MPSRNNVWSSFQKFFSTLISPFMTSQIPHIPALFISQSVTCSGCFEVDTWARLMQSCNDAAQCFVERVVHCKSEDDKRHEFLRFEISSPNGSHTAIVCADRRVEALQGVKQKATVLSPSPSPSVSENLLAIDHVWVATKGRPSETFLNDQFRNYTELRWLTFPHHGTRPSAQYLSALLQTISMHKKYYELYKYQCYWFAHTAFESLQILHPTSILVNGPHHEQRSQYCGSDFPKAESVDAVCKEFAEVWKTFLERDQRVQQAEQERLVERVRTENRAELERRLETQRLEHEAERQKEREAERREHEAERQKEREAERLEHEAERQKEREAERLEREAERREHEVERQQFLARIKALELGAK